MDRANKNIGRFQNNFRDEELTVLAILILRTNGLIHFCLKY